MRMLPRFIRPALVVLLLACAVSAQAAVQEGQPAPNFTKQQLDFPAFGQTTTRSLSDYLGKVVVLFVLGYN